MDCEKLLTLNNEQFIPLLNVDVANEIIKDKNRYTRVLFRGRVVGDADPTI